MRELSGEDGRRLTQPFDDWRPLPRGAAEFLSADNPRLVALRRAYAALDLPSLQQSQGGSGVIDEFFDLRYFRGESISTWHHRELSRATRLKLFIYLSYLQERDERGLLERLQEDGLFGCWTHEFSGMPMISRELLESVNELLFLQRRFDILGRRDLRVLDIGAGYGRLAYRMTQAHDSLADYCCLDALPESTFLCEYYLRFRGISPTARVVPLDQLGQLEAGQFDLAVNANGFSRCTLRAVQWWIDQLHHWEVPVLFATWNEPSGMFSTEPDGTRRDLMPLFADAGYRLTAREPVIDDRAVREITRVWGDFNLFELRTSG